MLRTLIESNAPRERRRGGTIASIAIHTAVIAGAIVATASAKAKPESVTDPVEGTVYVPTVPPQSETVTRPLPRRQRPSGETTDRWQLPERAWTPTFIPRLPTSPTVDVDPRA